MSQTQLSLTAFARRVKEGLMMQFDRWCYFHSGIEAANDFINRAGKVDDSQPRVLN